MPPALWPGEVINRLTRGVSLRSRLFLAMLMVLIVSFMLMGAIVWARVQSYTDQLARTQLTAAAAALIPPIRRELLNAAVLSSPAIVNTAALTTYLEPLRQAYRNVQIVLTGWNNDAILFADPPSALATSFPVSYSIAGGVTACGDVGASLVSQSYRTLLGRTYFYVAEPAVLPSSPTYCQPSVVRNIVLVQQTDVQARQTLTGVGGQIALAALLSLGIALLIAAVLVGYITRPLRRMTDASERMAAGDYNQHIPSSSDDEVGHLATSFNRMASEVQRARELQRQFIGNVSHDLKTPLTSILGFAQMLLDEGDDPALVRRAATVINQEARRLQRLTLDLLDLTRIEAGQSNLHHDTIDLTGLLGDIFARYYALALRSDIALEKALTPHPLLVRGDSDRLTQVIVNLYDNAIKFCRTSGAVTLTSWSAHNLALFSVTNTSDGIPPQEISRIFERFYRTDYARSRREGGTGLGLAIVKELVTAHGGQVFAESAMGQWVRVTVALPLAPPHIYTTLINAQQTDNAYPV